MDDTVAILDRVSPCLAEWNISPNSIELAAHSENIVYKVTGADQREYALRVHRPGYHTLDELIAEQMWTAAVHDYGIYGLGRCPPRTGSTSSHVISD